MPPAEEGATWSATACLCDEPDLSLEPRPTTIEMVVNGSFTRKDSVWRNWISNEDGATFQPEKDRYHLYAAESCPWAHRAMLTRALKGLEDVISVTIVMPGVYC